MVFSQSTYIERSFTTIKRSDFIARKMIDAQHTYLFPQPVNLRLLFLLVIFPSFSDRLNQFKSKMTVQGICTDLSLQKRGNPRQEVYNLKEEFDGKILPAKD